MTHSLGNLRCIDGAACVNTSGMTCQTTEQSCYAAHDEEAYISAVEYAVQLWRTGKAMRP